MRIEYFESSCLNGREIVEADVVMVEEDMCWETGEIGYHEGFENSRTIRDDRGKRGFAFFLFAVSEDGFPAPDATLELRCVSSAGGRFHRQMKVVRERSEQKFKLFLARKQLLLSKDGVRLGFPPAPRLDGVWGIQRPPRNDDAPTTVIGLSVNDLSVSGATVVATLPANHYFSGSPWENALLYDDPTSGRRMMMAVLYQRLERFIESAELVSISCESGDVVQILHREISRDSGRMTLFSGPDCFDVESKISFLIRSSIDELQLWVRDFLAPRSDCLTLRHTFKSLPRIACVFSPPKSSGFQEARFLVSTGGGRKQGSSIVLFDGIFPSEVRRFQATGVVHDFEAVPGCGPGAFVTIEKVPPWLRNYQLPYSPDKIVLWDVRMEMAISGLPQVIDAIRCVGNTMVSLSSDSCEAAIWDCRRLDKPCLAFSVGFPSGISSMHHILCHCGGEDIPRFFSAQQRGLGSWNVQGKIFAWKQSSEDWGVISARSCVVRK